MAEQKLAGQVALVTGAARRIGRDIALELAARGADVVVNFRRSRQDAERVAAEISRLGSRGLAVQADVSQRGEVARLMGEVEERFGRLDILVNNVGMFEHAPFADLNDEQWNRMLATNLTSQFLCAQMAAPLLKRAKQAKRQEKVEAKRSSKQKPSVAGRIINIASLGGLLAWPGYTHYCVSKAGVIMLTRCLARALAPEITVNAVAPGTISFPGDAPALEADYIRRTPLRRTGTGKDIAEAVAYLAQAEFITGQVLAVDGGRVLT
jgi:NAD(P)-dependent dehydrogenase (short-subunit alcohol dehydrogenase family)